MALFDRKAALNQLPQGASATNYMRAADVNALLDHTTGWINAKSHLPVGQPDGTTDNTAGIQAALDEAQTSGAAVFLPPGTYRADGIKLKTGDRLIGANCHGLAAAVAGAEGSATILKARDTSTTAVIEVDGAGTTYRKSIEIANLVIHGPSGPYTTAGVAHGIYVHDGPVPAHHSHIYVHDVSIVSVGGRGFYAPVLWHSTLERLAVDNVGDNAIEFDDYNTVLLSRCYVHKVATGKAGYRIHGGATTLIACNGLDVNTNADWGVFGGFVADGDPADRQFYGTIIGANVEYFGNRGMWFKAGSYATLMSPTFIHSQAGVTARALVVDDPGEGMVWIGGKVSLTGAGAAWANGKAVHYKTNIPIFIGAIPGIYSNTGNLVWEASVGSNGSAPTIRSWKTNLGIQPALNLIGGSLEQGIARDLSATVAWSGVAATWDPGSIADGAVATTTVTHAHAVVGDEVSVRFSQAIPAGAILSAAVSAAGQVAVTLFNKTGSPLDLASGTVRVRVHK